MSTWGITQENDIIEMRHTGTPISFGPASETETRHKMDRISTDLSTGGNDFENVALRPRPTSVVSLRSSSKMRGDNRSFGKTWEKTSSFAKLMTSKLNRRLQKSRYYGWRMGVLFGCYASAFVLCCNISLLVAGAFRFPNGYDQAGMADLVEGNEENIERWNTVFHIFINALSTVLLASSNYTMQVLSSPKRSEIDRAHRMGEWLDVGVLSLRNLRLISRKRAALCVLLALSSVPLHLFYNASIFKIIAIKEYRITTINVWSNEYERMHFTDASRNRILNVYINLSNSEWRQNYASEHVSRYSDLFLAVDHVAFETTENVGTFSMTHYLPGSLFANITGKNLSHPSSDMIPYRGFEESNYSNSSAPGPSTPTSLRVINGFTTRNTHRSHIQISLHFMIAVTLFNFFKLLIMVFVLFKDRSEYIVTLGDAAASFLETPDSTTAEDCLLMRGNKKWERSNQPLFATLEVESEEGESKYERHAWFPRLQQFNFWIKIDKGSPAIVSGLLLAIIVGAFPLFASDYVNAWAWGSASDNILQLGSIRGTADGMLFSAWLANMPQVLLSFCYLNLNTMCTSMASANEWNAFGSSRKGLRVTKRRGEQRSTYFLQLPYKWAIPLMTISGILHWLLSQTFFLVRFDAFDHEGTRKDQDSMSGCGASLSSLIVFYGVGLSLVIGVGWIGHRKVRPTVPPVYSCSLFISALCHPDSNEVDPHLGRVQWGVVEGSLVGGKRHCSLSSQPVDKPKVGEVYY